MAKTYIDIVKYMVEAKFEINGLVEKPDIIGAVFGQTEGLLGSTLDLRELQKNGKIGRIEIEQSILGNKTQGRLFLPSSLNRVETCILAAAIESVDRVGPFETSFKVEKVEDTRDEKRKHIIERAKDLVKTLLATEMPDSKEISELVETDVKASTISTYGQEALPAGPDVGKSDDVIIVEGRADVLNLLRNDISNVVAVGGASGTIPRSVISLCGEKDATLFVDGDRGGEMIIKELLEQADVDFIARAPDGKEVEELTRKEIIKALRSKIPIEQFLQQNNKYREYRKHDDDAKMQAKHKHNAPQEYQHDAHEMYDTHNAYNANAQYEAHDARQQDNKIISPSHIVQNMSRQAQQPSPAPSTVSSEEEFGLHEVGSGDAMDSIPKMDTSNFPEKKYTDALEELHNTLRGRLYDQSGNLIKEVPIRELMQAIQETKGVSVIVFDGIITQRLIEFAYSSNVQQIYGIRSNQAIKPRPGLSMYTSESHPAA